MTKTNGDQQVFHGEPTMFRGRYQARVERLRKYSEGSKLGARRRQAAIRQRIEGIAGIERASMEGMDESQ